MLNPMKVSIIGSSGFYAFDFYRRAFGDEKMQPIELRIWNRNPETGESIEKMFNYLIKQTGIKVDYKFFDNRKESLQGTDYILFTSCVDYPRTRVQDTQVCKKFGVYAMEGETMSPGGLMNTFRQVPILLRVAKEVEEVSPNAVVIPVVNPLARLCDALNRHSSIKFIGHCDGITHTRNDLAMAMGRNPKNIEVFAAGVNHLTFILKMWDKQTGEDLIPLINQAMPHIRQQGPFGFRFSNMVYNLLGYYPSPGDNHIADQLPFVSREMQQSIPIPSLDSVYASIDNILNGNAANVHAAKLAGERIQDPEVLKAFLNPPRYEETGTWMLALHGRIPTHHVEAINVANHGHITNLPEGSIIEVPGIINPGGAQGYKIGELPLPIASLCHRMIVAHELSVEACVSQSREAALQSLAMEPTIKDLSVIEDLLDALLDVNQKYLGDEFVSKMKKSSRKYHVKPVEPHQDNLMQPDAPAPENPPVLDVVLGDYWGSKSGNLADENIS